MRKQKRIYKKKSSEKIKRWTAEESKLYDDFITKYNHIFEEAGNKRIAKIFIFMSIFIGSKTASQCRSHHQKFYKKINENNDLIVKNRKSYKKKEKNEKNKNSSSNEEKRQENIFFIKDLGFQIQNIQPENESMQTCDETFSNRFSEHNIKSIEHEHIQQINNNNYELDNFKLPPSIINYYNEEDSSSYFKEHREFENELLMNNDFDDVDFFKKTENNYLDVAEEHNEKFPTNLNFVDECFKND